METFLNTFETTLQKFAPLRELSNREKVMAYKPWITKGILTSIKRRDALYRKYCKLKDPLSITNMYNKFKAYRNLIVNLKNKNNYYKEYFSVNKNNMIKTWRGIKGIININSTKNNNIINCIDINGEVTSDNSKIATSFNNFFTIVSGKVKYGIIPTHVSYKDFLYTPNANSIFLKATTEEEVKKLIKQLDSKKAIGPNSIRTKILKSCANVL